MSRRGRKRTELVRKAGKSEGDVIIGIVTEETETQLE